MRQSNVFLLGPEESLLSDARLRHSVRSSAWPGGTWLKLDSDLGEIQRLAGRFRNAKAIGRWLALCSENDDGWRALVEAAAERADAHHVRVVSPFEM